MANPYPPNYGPQPDGARYPALDGLRALSAGGARAYPYPVDDLSSWGNVVDSRGILGGQDNGGGAAPFLPPPMGVIGLDSVRHGNLSPYRLTENPSTPSATPPSEEPFAIPENERARQALRGLTMNGLTPGVMTQLPGQKLEQ